MARKAAKKKTVKKAAKKAPARKKAAKKAAPASKPVKVTAVAGKTVTASALLQAIADHRVSMLFVDSGTWADRTHVDETIRAAHADGAGVCPGPAPELTDGIGALLRRAY